MIHYKSIVILKSMFTILLLCASAVYSRASNYSTTQSGAWNTDGNWNPLSPGNTIATGDTAFVNHVMTISNDLNIEGVVVIANGASIDGNKKIKVKLTGVLINNGTIDITDEMDIDGSFYNYGYTSLKKLHIDGYLCNADTIEIDPSEKIDLHGGTIECGGTLLTCEIKMHDNGGAHYTLQQQNIDTCSMGCGTPSVDDDGNGSVDSSSTAYCGTTLNGTVLPVELLSFDAKADGGFVALEWITANEINNDYFILQRSNDQENWEEVAQLLGAGNTTRERMYQSMDPFPFSGINVYRLIQVDFDGTREVVATDEVFIGFAQELTVFPNPASGQLNLISDGSPVTEVIAYSMDGRALKLPIEYGDGHHLKMDVSRAPIGQYILMVKSQNAVMKAHAFVSH